MSLWSGISSPALSKEMRIRLTVLRNSIMFSVSLRFRFYTWGSQAITAALLSRWFLNVDHVVGRSWQSNLSSLLVKDNEIYSNLCALSCRRSHSEVFAHSEVFVSFGVADLTAAASFIQFYNFFSRDFSRHFSACWSWLWGAEFWVSALISFLSLCSAIEACVNLSWAAFFWILFSGVYSGFEILVADQSHPWCWMRSCVSCLW